MPSRHSLMALGAALFSLLMVAPSANAQTAITGARQVCTGGTAAGFPCRDVDLLSYLPLADLQTSSEPRVLNDIWGWTDPDTGSEYALVGRADGTSFVDVSDPVNPLFLGNLPLTPGATPNAWRDIKVYQNYAFIVADNVGAHGMQVFDLTQLRSVTDAPQMFEADLVYTGSAPGNVLGSAHNIVINEETGFAYAVGAGTCGGGLHMINIQDPLNPSFVGCFNHANLAPGPNVDGYSHDAQCVVYRGADPDYENQEICIGSNQTGISVADVTDKQNPVPVAFATYPTAGYVHQGWLTEDHRYFFQDDETDELRGIATNTRTLIWDLTDLDDPLLLGEHIASTQSIDHNLYIKGDYVFQSNYTSGLRILDIQDVSSPVEVGFFDTTPGNDAVNFSGSWSNYPFFESGVIVVSSIGEGLFVLAPSEGSGIATSTETLGAASALRLSGAYPSPFEAATTLDLDVAVAEVVRIAAYDLLGREVAVLHDGPLSVGTHSLEFEAGGLASGLYLIRATSPTGIQVRRVVLSR